MTFPTNLSAVTVWEKTVIDHAPAYIRHELGACYWEDTRGQTVRGSDARTPEDSVFLAIPAGSVGDYVPQKDDRVLPGSVPEEKPPNTALTVMQVKDFRYGAAMMQHVEVALS